VSQYLARLLYRTFVILPLGLFFGKIPSAEKGQEESYPWLKGFHVKASFQFHSQQPFYPFYIICLEIVFRINPNFSVSHARLHHRSQILQISDTGRHVITYRAQHCVILVLQQPILAQVADRHTVDKGRCQSHVNLAELMPGKFSGEQYFEKILYLASKVGIIA